MNSSYDQEIFPDTYGNLRTLFPFLRRETNHKAVALLRCIEKLQERIVFKNMYTFLIDNNLLYKYQSGFLPHHSTVFQLIDIFHNMSSV